VCLLSEWRQVGIVLGALRNGQAHSSKHGIFFGFLQLALLLFDSLSLGFLGLGIALCIPVQVAALLPATHGGHERVAQVVFALRIAFDIFPLELSAAATVCLSVLFLAQESNLTYRLPSFLTV
jgi:hypothetical protein